MKKKEKEIAEKLATALKNIGTIDKAYSETVIEMLDKNTTLPLMLVSISRLGFTFHMCIGEYKLGMAYFSTALICLSYVYLTALARGLAKNVGHSADILGTISIYID